MNGKERLLACLAGEGGDCPLFLPAISEHRARLIGVTPSALCQSAAAMTAGLQAEHEVYGLELLVVGMDHYNVEAEALGCGVRYFEESDAVPVVDEPILDSRLDCAGLSLPDPETSGRMPLCLEAARAVQAQLGAEVLIQGGLSGPFSMASELAGAEALMMAMLTDPAAVAVLLDFCSEVALAYGTAYLDAGVGVCLYDSRATPELISPGLYRQLVQPCHARVVAGLKAKGAGCVPLILGGDTGSIVDDLVATGATWLIADHRCDQEAVVAATEASGVALRLNIDPAFYEGSGGGLRPFAELGPQVGLARRASRCLLGTGPVPYHTETEQLRRLIAFVRAADRA